MVFHFERKSKSKSLWDTPSFKYRHRIKKLVEPLRQIDGFGNVAICLLLKSGDKALVSSALKTSLKIVAAGLQRGNLLLNYHFAYQTRVVFPEEFSAQDELQSSISKICEADRLYSAYCITRTCQDCSVLIAVNASRPITHKLGFYQGSIDQLEIFANHFFDKAMDIFIDELPALANSRFATEAEFRHRVLLTRTVSKKDIDLTESELEVLYWSAQGKSADEIAAILGLTKNTVDTYRRRLIEKMEVSNITQAVYVASSAGLIV
ncbi:MAG: hypothetical protein A3F17_08915 [Gammaproteobacteria bacterium RIFCSPHIGHO2_12_FULL_41_15]|nr:MAG: hypothetical protein A3F17_08915 [Gammaproteobacteria bacterium RIFCSPHIGHO2_12_FULL_41_15]